MNESRFKLFLLYMIDLHNLNLKKMVEVLANPLNESRNNAIYDEGEKRSHSTLSSKPADFEKEIESLTSCLEAIDVNRGGESNYFSKTAAGLSCNYCPAVYSREGQLRNHLASKHNKFYDLICVCGTSFPDTTKFNRHKKSCKKITE